MLTKNCDYIFDFSTNRDAYKFLFGEKKFFRILSNQSTIIDRLNADYYISILGKSDYKKLVNATSYIYNKKFDEYFYFYLYL